MKWTHLPVTGGLYDQHPHLLDDFLVIMQIESRVERDRMEAERRKSQQTGGKRGMRR